MNVRLLSAKTWVFIRRDFRIASSYRLNFFLTSLNSLFILTLLFFIGRMIEPDTLGLGQYDGAFFPFVLVGFGFYQYFQLSLTNFSNIIQREQLTGCLEAMVATQTRPEASILFSSLYAMLSNLIQLLLIFGAGVLIFRVDIRNINIPTTILAFVLSLGVFTSFGILSAAFIVVLKKGDPITWVLTTLQFILGGAFFPIEQMPRWMQTAARFVPATYALKTLRESMLNAAGVSELAAPLTILGGIAVVLFPLSLVILQKAVRKTKYEGTLVFY